MSKFVDVVSSSQFCNLVEDYWLPEGFRGYDEKEDEKHLCLC